METKKEKEKKEIAPLKTCTSRAMFMISWQKCINRKNLPLIH